ncbi:DUF2951 family protein, partial [Staphylococcus aureus]
NKKNKKKNNKKIFDIKNLIFALIGNSFITIVIALLKTIFGI